MPSSPTHRCRLTHWLEQTHVRVCTAGSDRMVPTQPKHRHADRQCANGETEVGWRRRGANRTGVGKKTEQMGESTDDWWLKVREKTTERQRKKGGQRWVMKRWRDFLWTTKQLWIKSLILLELICAQTPASSSPVSENKTRRHFLSLLLWLYADHTLTSWHRNRILRAAVTQLFRSPEGEFSRAV